MFLPAIFDSIESVLKDNQVDEILKESEKYKKTGLILSREDAIEIIKVREQVLQNYGRIEFGIEVIKNLIQNISVSDFICEEEYVSIINELQELFYYMKNETEDLIGDDEIISILDKLYNNSCAGTIELLKESVETFCINYRNELQKKSY